MNLMHKTFTGLFICFLLLACSKQSPQTPSNKGNVADKNAVSLLAINQNLAKKEDSILKKFALQQNKAFKKSPIGFWYKIDHLGNGSGIKDSVICKFSYKLLSLTGKMLQQDQRQIVIGKKQVVTGLEEGLKLMDKGDSATIIVPWYLAYGMKGNGPAIPAYTSIIYKIKVLN
jgi:FKBP-type peptidyl-prolyl cis-trans isomerase FkpA